MSKDIFESFLTIQYDERSFFVLRNLEKDIPSRIFGIKKLPKKKFPSIEKIDNFGYKKLAVFSNTGNLFIYTIDDNADKIVMINQFKYNPGCNSISCSFTIFISGEICAFFTKDSNGEVFESLKVFRILKKGEKLSKELSKKWVFELDNLDRDSQQRGSFDFVFANFIYEGMPLIFAVENFVDFCNLVVFQVNGKEIKLIKTIDRIVDQRIIWAESFESKIYLLDGKMRFKIFKLRSK